MNNNSHTTDESLEKKYSPIRAMLLYGASAAAVFGQAFILYKASFGQISVVVMAPAIAVFLLPSAVAMWRRRPDTVEVVVLNCFTGLNPILWIITLGIALFQSQPTDTPPKPAQSKPDQISTEAANQKSIAVGGDAPSASSKSKLDLLGACVLTFLAPAYLGFAILLTGADVQPHLIPLTSSVTIQVLSSLWLASAAFGITYGFVKWKRLDWRTLLLRAILPFVTVCFLFATTVWVNITLDRPGIQRTFVVTDAFTIDFEGNYRERYLALSVPEMLGANRVWAFRRSVELSGYPIGTQIKATTGDGFLGVPWCEFQDEKFAHLVELRELRRTVKPIRRPTLAAERAHGRFSSDTPYQAQMESWGIPVEAAATGADESAK